MEYKEVFSVGYKESILFFILILLLILVFYFVYRYSDKTEVTDKKGDIILRIYGALVICIFILCILIFINMHQYVKLISKDYQVIEGKIENFQQQIDDGVNKRHEQFEIKGKKFDYSSFVITGAYNKPFSKGGYINEGEQVRLYYNDNDILKIFILINKK